MDPMSYLVEIKHALKNEAGSYEEFLQIMLAFKAEKISHVRLISKLRKLFHGHEKLIVGFNKFPPKEYKITVTDEESAFSFVKKVETVFLSDKQIYIDFLGVLDLYKKGIISIIELYRDIAVLFHGYPELLLEFNNFLPDTSVTPSDDITHPKKKRKIENNFVEEKVGGRLKSTVAYSELYERVNTCVELYSNEIVTRLELRKLVANLVVEYPNQVKRFDEFLENIGKTKESDDRCSSESTEKSNVQLDLSEYEQITPSYWVLRKDMMRSKDLTGRLNCKVLRKKPFRNRRLHRYEQKLNDCEDELYEMDLQRRPLNETIESRKRVSSVMAEYNKNWVDYQKRHRKYLEKVTALNESERRYKVNLGLV